jgi:hypothetical protein
MLALPAPAAAATSGGATPPVPFAGGIAVGSASVDKAALPTKARLVRGKAVPPVGAPLAVRRAILEANRIVGKPYVWGGGHREWISRGYDCSGAVSFALHGGGLLSRALDSSSFLRWGRAGKGRWITVYTNPGHAYVEISGLRLDTSAAGDPRGGRGPRWRPVRSSHRGFRARHAPGL